MRSLVVTLIFLTVPTYAALPVKLPAGDYQPKKAKYNMPLPKGRESSLREDAFARAKVWREPQVAIERANLRDNEQASDGFNYETELFCKWAASEKMNGATAKFTCVLPGGDTVKVKYARKGKSNPEIQGEALATRLVRALGFATDRTYLVRTLRCFGCPDDPWALITQMHSPFDQIRQDFYRRYGTQDRDGNWTYEPNFGKFTDFTEVAIERKLEGRRVEAKDNQGWGWPELVKVDASKGGATRAEVDALKLLSSFLQHSDNKPDNQVLVCQDRDLPVDGRCLNPVAGPSDLGGTFGSGFHGTSHSKAEVTEWSKTPIWTEGCRVHVNTSPTGSWDDSTISEGGRALLASLLERLSENQIRDLFEGAHVSQWRHGDAANKDVDRWVQVFKTKRTQISNQRCR
ncbi:MAG: hypothetical protein ABL958_06210 [Bdellovibrionia bacterium]